MTFLVRVWLSRGRQSPAFLTICHSLGQALPRRRVLQDSPEQGQSWGTPTCTNCSVPRGMKRERESEHRAVELKRDEHLSPHSSPSFFSFLRSLETLVRTCSYLVFREGNKHFSFFCLPLNHLLGYPNRILGDCLKENPFSNFDPVSNELHKISKGHCQHKKLWGSTTKCC